MQWFEQAVSEYLSDAKSEYVSPVTYKYKKNFLGRLSSFLNGGELNEQSARAYCSHLPDIGWKPSSAYHEIVELRTFLKWCWTHKFFTDNFIDRIKKPKLDSEAPQIPLVDMETAEKAIILGTESLNWYNKIARRVSEDMRIALLLILYTSLRFSEVKKLKWSDLFLDATPAHLFTILKGHKKPSQIYLPKEAVALLRPLAGRKQLFQINNDTCNRAINRGLKKLGIPFEVKCHGLRHIVGNEENRQGMSGYYLQHHMNHSKFETTQKFYLQNNLDDLAHQVDLYNPLARRSLSAQDKLNTLYDQARRWIGSDDALLLEKRPVVK